MFDVPAEAYDRFMGRYSQLLAPRFADFAGVERGRRVVDVGCGPGALTAELVGRVGAANVSAVDPSATFVAAVRARQPGVEVRQGSAEALPFATASFDLALAQLVVHFMAEPVIGLREMARVSRPGGIVAACVWDHAGDGGPLSQFWRAVRDVDPGANDESELAGAREGHLVELFRSAGIHDPVEGVLMAEREHSDFDDWWAPFSHGAGPAGSYVAGLTPDRQAGLRERCRKLFPATPFVITARAWAVRGRA